MYEFKEMNSILIPNSSTSELNPKPKFHSDYCYCSWSQCASMLAIHSVDQQLVYVTL